MYRLSLSRIYSSIRPSRALTHIYAPTHLLSRNLCIPTSPGPPKIKTKSGVRKKAKTIRKVEKGSHGEEMLLGMYDGIPGIPPEDRKTVHAVCSADHYDLAALFAHYSDEYETCHMYGGEVLRFSHMDGKECFVFEMGAFVAWNTDWKEFTSIREELRRFEVSPVAECEFEEIDYALVGEREHSVFIPQAESLMLIGGAQSEQNISLDQLAFSHGIANSVKLAVLEAQMDNFLESIKDVPETLKRGHRISFTRTDALSKLGELLQYRSVLNFHSGLSETPDLYWNYGTLEGHFSAISDELDIKKRVDTLNKKLDYANDIAELLKDYLSEKHSLSLEWCIIGLIAVEVAFELLHFAERAL